MTCLLAVDPGLTGTMAVYMTALPDRIAIFDMPVVDGEINHHALRDMIRAFGPMSPTSSGSGRCRGTASSKPGALHGAGRSGTFGGLHRKPV